MSNKADKYVAYGAKLAIDTMITIMRNAYEEKPLKLYSALEVAGILERVREGVTARADNKEAINRSPEGKEAGRATQADSS